MMEPGCSHAAFGRLTGSLNQRGGLRAAPFVVRAVLAFTCWREALRLLGVSSARPAATWDKVLLALDEHAIVAFANIASAIPLADRGG
jgi:hypothetical protein